MTETRVECAGGIVFDADGRLLLIRRGHEPGAGRWSVPGGKCRPGEAPELACVRELAEETGLQVVVLAFAGRVERPASPGTVFDIYDYVCAVAGGELAAGDDASDARWVSRADLDALEAGGALVDGLVDALAGWELLPT